MLRITNKVQVYQSVALYFLQCLCATHSKRWSESPLSVFLQDFDAKVTKMRHKEHFWGLFLNPGQHKNAALAPQKADENKLSDMKSYKTLNQCFGANLKKQHFLLNFAANLLLFCIFFSFLAQTMLKMTISASVLHPKGWSKYTPIK